jgi:hypothetical protein
MIQEIRFARDSPLEEAGFEPSVPRDTSEVSRGAHVSIEFVADSPLEEAGFELPVPRKEEMLLQVLDAPHAAEFPPRHTCCGPACLAPGQTEGVSNRLVVCDCGSGSTCCCNARRR